MLSSESAENAIHLTLAFPAYKGLRMPIFLIIPKGANLFLRLSATDALMGNQRHVCLCQNSYLECHDNICLTGVLEMNEVMRFMYLTLMLEVFGLRFSF